MSAVKDDEPKVDVSGQTGELYRCWDDCGYSDAASAVDIRSPYSELAAEAYAERIYLGDSTGFPVTGLVVFVKGPGGRTVRYKVAVNREVTFSASDPIEETP
jgi:hypothetical protein